MPTNTGNTGSSGQNEPFVKRFEMAIMQYVVLSKAQQGEVTKENLKQAFRGNLQMSGDHFERCIQQLVSDKHLEEVNGKYKISEDGREDIQKLQTLVLELPNVVQQGGNQGQRQGVQQTPAAGGRGVTGSTNVGQGNTGGNVGGNPGANVGGTGGGNVGGSQNKGQQGQGQNR